MDKPGLITYNSLRLLIGCLAFAIVFGCVLGGVFFGGIGIQPHISGYYYTNMRDFMESILFGIGAFLMCYYGYSKQDRLVNTLAGISAIGIALFPCDMGITPLGIFQVVGPLSGILHVVFAGIFFILLAYEAFFLFTKTDPNVAMTPRKEKRNLIYRICGIIIAASVIGLGICNVVVPAAIMAQYSIGLIWEILMLFPFGFSWLVKGGFILKDI